jgi:transcriptional regulator with XRE-family HTH domain
MEDKPESFAERVRKLREGKNLTQGKLAELADLSPAALSKLLNDDRPPRMEHILALAKALGILPYELVLGTEAEASLRDWVRREELEQCEKGRIELLQQLDRAKAEAAFKTAEVQSLADEVQHLVEKVRRLEAELTRSSEERGKAQQALLDASTSGKELSQATLTNLGLKAKIQQLEASLSAAREEGEAYHRSYDQAMAWGRQLQWQLSASQDQKVGVAVISGALGLLLGGMGSKEG